MINVKNKKGENCPDEVSEKKQGEKRLIMKIQEVREQRSEFCFLKLKNFFIGGFSFEGFIPTFRCSCSSHVGYNGFLLYKNIRVNQR